MPLYQKGDVRINYQEAGSGFPLLKERIPLAVRQVRSFLRAHRPATA